MNKKRVYIISFFIVSAYCLGVISQKYNWFPLKQIKSLTYEKKEVKKDFDTLSIKDFSNENFTVLFTFGQSNAANFGQTRHTCLHNVYNWHNDTIYKAKDPLKGADGVLGSTWSRLGDLLVESGFSENVLIVSLAMGNSTISDWSLGGKYHKKLIKTIEKLNHQNIEVDYILWHQGETDNINNTSKKDYIDSFFKMYNSLNFNNKKPPFFIAIASYIPREELLVEKQKGTDTIIQNAQKTIAEKAPNIHLGPNTDELIQSYYRHDGLHFSTLGLDKHAEKWLHTLKNYKEGILNYRTSKID